VHLVTPSNVGRFLINVNQWIQNASGSARGQPRKDPRVLFEDIESSMISKRDFLRKQKALLKEIMIDYGYLGTKISVLRAT